MKTGSDLIRNGEIILAGSVMLDEYLGWMYEEDVFFTPRMVREALAALGEGPVTVRINSMGGHASAGEEIRTTLAAHPGGATLIVEGEAASAASLIFMAGRQRLMSQGSMLMLHDPSGAVWGNEAEARRQADMLATLSNTYAAVYASAAGKTVEEARAIMRAETWYGPDAAIAEGFATGLSTPDALPAPVPEPVAAPALEAARAAFMAAGETFRTHLSRKPAPGAEAASAGAMTPITAHAPTNEEPAMPTPTTQTTPTDATTPTTMAAPAAQPPVQPAPSQPSPAEMMAAERARIRNIREMAAPFLLSGRLVQGDVDALVDEGTSLSDAGLQLMSRMAAAEPAGHSANPRATITRDETDTRLEGMIGAMMRQDAGPAADYRGLTTPKRLAVELAGGRAGFETGETVRRGMRATTMTGGALGVSDFAHITSEVIRRTLVAEYERRGATWQAVTGTAITASDFRELHAVRFGGDFALKPVQENGEYQQATLTDEAEGLKVERRGRTIRLTFEAVMNDDMSAFARIPREFAMAARTMESAMVWSLFRTNARLKSDGKALFHADHKNLATTAGAISVTTIAAARKAMWEQLAYGGASKDDFLQIEADRIIIPPALELAALQFTAAVTPGRDGDVNPYKATLSPVVVPNLGAAAGGSDAAWYLVSGDLPPIQHAYLEGYEAPTVQTVEGMNPDVVTLNARHIFGAAAVEFRGAYKNAGG